MKKILTILILILFSCNRENDTAKENVGGANPDNPKAIERTHLIVSNSFVAYKGRPRGNYDDDGDGVINKSDRCPSVYGTDGYGCPIVSPPPTDTVVTPPPSSTEVSLKCPPIGDQGSEGSCVAWAEGYAARAIDWYYKTGGIVTFSPEFLYNLCKFGTCAAGTAMQVVLDTMIHKGVCIYAAMPYNDGDCMTLPNASQLSNATNYKITGYSKISKYDLGAIRAMIQNKKAVIATILPDNTFVNAKAGFVWKVNTGATMGHTIAIVGYDDTKNAFKIMNSWGTSWGDAGFGWIDYTLFPDVTGTYAYVIN